MSIKKIILILSSVLPSIIRVYTLKLLGFKVHTTAKIGIFTLILAEKIEIGKHAKIGSLSIIKCDKNLVIKEKAEVSSFVLIYGESSLFMDAASYIGPRAMINVSRDVTIGYYSAIGPGSYIYTHGVWLPYTDGYPRKFAPVKLQSYVWLPAKVFVGPGVEIGKNTIASSGISIYKNISSNLFYTGGTKPSMPISFILNKDDTYQRVIDLLVEFIEKFENETNSFFSFNDELNRMENTFKFKNKVYRFVVFKSKVSLLDIKKYKECPNDIYFLPEFEEPLLSDDYQAFCFKPIVCSVPKTKPAKKLLTFFERECGLRFGFNKPLIQSFED
jgi:acetyltransferase-like isoleucine patch superfamily enzyme